MSLVAQTLWLGDRELAFVNLALLLVFGDVGCQRRCCRAFLFCFGRVVWKEVFARAAVPPAVVVRWTRDRGGVIGMQAKALFLAGWAQRRRGGCHVGPTNNIPAIKLKPEWFAKSGQGALGGIGLRRLDCGIVNFTRRVSTAFARAMAFADDLHPVCFNCNTHLRRIDSEECATVLPAEHTAGFNRLPAPGIKAEDAVGLRDRISALDIG